MREAISLHVRRSIVGVIRQSRGIRLSQQAIADQAGVGIVTTNKGILHLLDEGVISRDQKRVPCYTVNCDLAAELGYIFDGFN